MLGHDQLSQCLETPVVTNAVNLQFNAPYYEELFGLGWSEFDQLRLVLRLVNAPAVYTRNSIRHNGGEVIVTLFGEDRPTIENQVKALNAGQPTPFITSRRA